MKESVAMSGKRVPAIYHVIACVKYARVNCFRD